MVNACSAMTIGCLDHVCAMEVPNKIFFVFDAAAANSDKVSDEPPLDVIHTAGIPILSASIMEAREPLGDSPLKSNPIILAGVIKYS